MYRSILIVSGILLLNSCSTPEKLICRTWKVDKVDFNEPKNEFESKIQQSIKQMVPDLRFTFKRDSTYIGGKEGTPLTGTWWFTNKKRGIVMTSAEQKTDGKIITLSKTSLVIDNTGPQGNEIKFVLSPAPTAKK
jgi:hypothetical protein